MARSTFAAAGLMVLSVALLFATSANAGAVFEIREPVPTNPADLKFSFGGGANQTTTVPGAGSIKRSGGVGAGAFFKASAVPLNLFTLEKCAAVAPHVHPNAGETIFVIAGKLKIYQFRGEEDATAVRTIELGPNQAGYVQQGAYHFAENTAPGRTIFLQIFDHPQGGTNFIAPGLVALRNANPAVVNSAFSADVVGSGVSGIGPLIQVRGCKF